MTAVQTAFPFGDDNDTLSHPRPARGPGRIEDDLVWRAIAMVDGSPVLPAVEEWKKEERRGPGGRPETFPVRALVVAMLLCAMTAQPMLATTFTDVLFRQISPTMRHALGVPKPPARVDRRGWDDVYRNVRTRLHGLLGLMDPSWLPKNRRLDDVDFAALVELRHAMRSDEEWERREERLTWFINQVLEMSIRTLPRAVRRKWRGSACVDATVIPAFARQARRDKRKTKDKKPATITHSSDPDADWYSRGKRVGKDGETEPQMSVWAYEGTFVVSGSDDPNDEQFMPILVMGMAPLHRPGTQPGKRAVVALADIRQRGHPTHQLAGDRAYTNAKADEFQLPARALGYQLVLDYTKTQLGHQGSYQGMILVDGNWYCPGMPEQLVNATKDFRDKKIDDETHRARLEERWKYAIVPKAGPDGGGHVRLRCPASNPAPVARCELKPRSVRPSTLGRLRVPVTDALRPHPPAICVKESITVPPEAGAKYAQPLFHESEKWRAVYGSLRAGVEHMNGFVKDGSHEAIDDPERRRIRGVAAQSVFVALLLCAANLRKIDMYHAQAEAEANGSVRRLPSRRTTKDLTDWLPPSGAITSEHPPAGPAPPLIA